MKFSIDDHSPIYMQIANQLEDLIFTHVFKENEQVPSTTELSQLLSINPHTVLKGMNLLVDEGILVKKRGLGFFVTPEAKQYILNKRRAVFFKQTIQLVVKEAKNLDLSKERLIQIIQEVYDERD